MNDFFRAINEHLSLEVLDLSRNHFDSNITDSLIDSVLCKKQLGFRVLDLRYNLLSERDNLHVYDLYSNSRNFKCFELQLEPFIKTTIFSMPAAVKQSIHNKADRDGMLKSSLTDSKALPQDLNLFDSFVDKAQALFLAESSDPRISMQYPSGDRPFDGLDVNHAPVSAQVLESIGPANAPPIAILTAAHNKSPSTNKAVKASAEKLADYMGRIESVSLEDIHAIAKPIKGDSAAVIDAIGTNGFELLERWARSKLLSAIEGHDAHSMNIILEIATGLGLSRIKLDGDPDIHRRLLALQGRTYRFVKNVSNLLNFQVFKADELNDKLDELCQEALSLSLRGDAVDMLFLVREQRNKMLLKFADDHLQPADLELEIIEKKPFPFLNVNKDFSEWTKTMFDAAPGEQEYEDLARDEFSWAGTHENWLDYEKLSSLSRNDLISMLGERLESPSLHSKKTIQTFVKMFMLRRATFILSQPTSSFYRMFKVDTLLSQARLLCRYRWAQGHTAETNLASVLELRDMYLPALLSKSIGEGYGADMRTDFFKDDLKPRRELIAQETKIREKHKDELVSKINIILSRIELLCSGSVTQELNSDVASELTNADLLSKLNTAEISIHPSQVLVGYPQLFLTSVLQLPLLSRYHFDDTFKITANIALMLLSRLDSSQEENYKILLLYVLIFCLFENPEAVNLSDASSFDKTYLLSAIYKLKLNELMVELMRVSDIQVANKKDELRVKACTDILLVLSAIINFEEDKFVFYVLQPYFTSNYAKYKVWADSGSEDGAAIVRKSLIIMSNLLDVLKYPRFSDFDIGQISLNTLLNFFDSGNEDLLTTEFNIKLQVPGGEKTITVSQPGYMPVQTIYDSARLEAARYIKNENFLNKYWLFVVFEGNTANHPLTFDTQLFTVKHLMKFHGLTMPQERDVCWLEFRPRIWTVKQHFFDITSEELDVIFAVNFENLSSKIGTNGLFKYQELHELLTVLSKLLEIVDPSQVDSEYSYVKNFLEVASHEMSNGVTLKEALERPDSETLEGFKDNPSLTTSTIRATSSELKYQALKILRNFAFFNSRLYKFITSGIIGEMGLSEGWLSINWTGLHFFKPDDLRHPHSSIILSQIVNLTFYDQELVLEYMLDTTTLKTDLIHLRTFHSSQIVEDIVSTSLMAFRENRLLYYSYSYILPCLHIEAKRNGSISVLFHPAEDKDTSVFSEAAADFHGSEEDLRTCIGHVQAFMNGPPPPPLTLGLTKETQNTKSTPRFELYPESHSGKMYMFHREMHQTLTDQFNDTNSHKSFAYIVDAKPDNDRQTSQSSLTDKDEQEEFVADLNPRGEKENRPRVKSKGEVMITILVPDNPSEEVPERRPLPNLGILEKRRNSTRRMSKADSITHTVMSMPGNIIKERSITEADLMAELQVEGKPLATLIDKSQIQVVLGAPVEKSRLIFTIRTGRRIEKRA